MVIQTKFARNDVDNMAIRVITQINDTIQSNEEMTEEQISTLFFRFPVLSGDDMFYIDKETYSVIGSSNKDYVRKRPQDIGLPSQERLHEDIGFPVSMNGDAYYCYFRAFDKYYIGIARSFGVIHHSVYASISYMLGSLALAAIAIILWVNYYLKKEHISIRKGEAVLEAAGFGFSAYLVLDWNTEECLDYNVADDNISPFVHKLLSCKTYT